MKNNELRNILHNASKELEKELKKNALPSKKTGSLDKSFKSRGYEIKGDVYVIKCDANYYAKYVNAHENAKAKNFIDKSIKTIIDDQTDNIIKSQYNGVEYLFSVSPTKTNYPSPTKKYI